MSKTKYPHLQAIKVEGATLTKENIIEALYEVSENIKKMGKGVPGAVFFPCRHCHYYKNISDIVHCADHPEAPDGYYCVDCNPWNRQNLP